MGHGSTVDALQLLKHYGINTQNIFDTESFASQLKTNLVSLKGLAAMFLGLRIVKAKQMSNWERPTLSTGQVDYASGDAWAALQVYFAMLQYVWYIVCVASYPAGRSLAPRPTPFFFFCALVCIQYMYRSLYHTERKPKHKKKKKKKKKTG